VLDRCVDNFFAETEQVAFGTLNIVPGIDFSDDPLLQGRNFSYLDTQLKRLGSPNFTHIPVNAPKCPFHHFQQDGHMALHNPPGRANYEPNSWGGATGGPRESPEQGFHSYPAAAEGPKRRIRSASFADHYSQARQFYRSQTASEQQHIADALIFELSKVETLAIRTRVVSHLLNTDQDLAEHVADGLRLKELPRPADAARPTLEHLQKSPALSIQLNGPARFTGRKVGALVTDGVESAIVRALYTALEEEGALLEIVAPHVGGVEASDGSWIDAAQQLRGGPSVLYDAVALLPSADGVESLMQEPTARDFIADAFAHCKFIGYVETALPLFGKAGVADSRDDGCIALEGPDDCAAFIATCRQLRFWAREAILQHAERQGV
jgi:catalase